MRGIGLACVVAGALAIGLLSGCAVGSLDSSSGTTGTTTTTATGPALSPAAVMDWNSIAIDASGLDSTPVAPGDDRVGGYNVGPGRASRAMAIVHIAIFEAVNAIHGGYQSYVNLEKASSSASAEAAIATAAHDTLVALFPDQKAGMDQQLDVAIKRLGQTDAVTVGQDVGHKAAAAILADRANDGSAKPDPHVGTDWTCSDAPGHWRPDPVSKNTVALGAYWSEVKPFVMESASQFRCTTPPALGSQEYRDALTEAHDLGGDGITTTTKRTLTDTVVGIFWAYDAAPALCAPPRLYNQIAALIAAQKGSDMVETARLLAIVNVAMADAAIAGWESKYHYDMWRPVCAIREIAPGTGPSGLGDGDPLDLPLADPEFTPLGAPSSNTTKTNFTPPFPSYPSGHAAFGGALFETLRNFYGTDDIPFDFMSDEFNGKTTDNTGQVRPKISRHFSNLSQAEDENGQSRIYLGIHYRFDKDAGITQGRAIADLVGKILYPAIKN